MENKPTFEPLSSKLKRISTRPTNEPIPKLPAAKYDELIGADMFSKRTPKNTKKPSL